MENQRPAGDSPLLPTGTIIFDRVTKTYQIAQRATPRVGAWLLNKAFEYFRSAPFHALQDVSFRIEPGEMVGFLGHNGAGKSSVLKLIAGITQPTSGTVTVSGPVTSLLELGVGFHPELTGMENIFYNGAIMGLGRSQIMARLEAIIAFSGLVDFLYEPVKHYSSGMYSRLACSVALHLDPKIMLVDEILGVGDADFQQRSILKMLELHRQGVTVLLVTHDPSMARDVWDRVIWLEGGRVREVGDPHGVQERYTRAMMERVHRDSPFADPLAAPGEGTARLASVRFFAGEVETDTVRTDDGARVEVRVEGGASAVRLGLQWRWADGRILAEDFSDPIALENGAAQATYAIPRFPFLHSRITVTAVVLDARDALLLDRRVDALRLTVETPGFELEHVLLRPRVTWSVKAVDLQRSS